MPDRTRAPFRADHVGSFKRPPCLLEAREEFAAGEITKEELKETEDRAVRYIIPIQKRLGIKSITDGEYRREFFYDGFFERIEGIKMIDVIPASAPRSFIPSNVLKWKTELHTAPMVVSKLKRSKPIYLEEFEGIKALVDPEDVAGIKITIVSPLWLDLHYGKNWVWTKGIYESRDELFEDVARIFREEIADLYAAGCRNIQIDEPGFTFLCNPPTIKGFQDVEGLTVKDVLEDHINVFNACLRDVPEDMTTGVHLCRGNYRGMHFAEGSYDNVAELLFQKLNVDCYYLEYDTDRAGGFGPLVHLPKEKLVVLGLVSTKTPKLETVDSIVERINEAVKIIKDAHPERTEEEVLNQLCLSPQCGFASECQGNPITDEDAENKIKLVVEVAKKVWKY